MFVAFSAISRVFRDFWRFGTQTVTYHNGMLPKSNDLHHAFCKENAKISLQHQASGFRKNKSTPN